MTLKPFQQGSLDCFCGLYSVINAIKFLSYANFNFSYNKAFDLFCYLIKNLQEKDKLESSLVYGMNVNDLYYLLRKTREFLYENYNLHISIRKPFNRKIKISFEDFIIFLDNNLNQTNKTIILGTPEHWTVFYKITENNIYIFDSFGGKYYPIKNCSIAVLKNKKYQLFTYSLFIVEVL